jgi:hypothetical protein
MSNHPLASRRAVTEHSVTEPGETIYHRTEGSGRPLVLIGGGPSNADTLGALAATHPDRLARAIVHQPPLAQLIPASDQASFDVALDSDDTGRALDQIAASIGVTRGWTLTSSGDQSEVRRGDIELFIRRDVPAIADYRVDLGRLASPAVRIVVVASEAGRVLSPPPRRGCRRRARNPAGHGHGNHAAMITHPSEIAECLAPLLA